MYNNELKILKMQEQMDGLLELLSNDWQNLEIHTVEEKLFRVLLEIGKTALTAFVEKKGIGADIYGEDISNHSEKKCNYLSIFGMIELTRAYFWKQGIGGGVFPIDKEYNLPEKQYSYLLQNWNQLLAVDSNYDSARETLERIFGINIWSNRSLEINENAAKSVDEFYKSHPEEPQSEPILVAQADGKGIVMRKESKDTSPEIKIRLKKGEKNGKKKMSTVSAVYGIDKNIRDVNDIIKYETENSDNNPKKPKLQIVKDDGPKPQNKIVRATLEGKDKAFERIVSDVESRDPDNTCERVLLIDGEPALEKKAEKYLKPIGFVIVLDLFHVMERLWKLAYYFCKEGTKESVLWVKKYLTMILSGKVGYFIGAIRQIVKKRGISESKKKQIEELLRYYEKRKKYMKYDEYLKNGYPIGSGVIEGACRSFVKDRMELAGMRWSEVGAESMLQLRSIKVNGKWDSFWNHYVEKEKLRLYGGYDSYMKKAYDVMEKAG